MCILTLNVALCKDHWGYHLLYGIRMCSKCADCCSKRCAHCSCTRRNCHEQCSSTYSRFLIQGATITGSCSDYHHDLLFFAKLNTVIHTSNTLVHILLILSVPTQMSLPLGQVCYAHCAPISLTLVIACICALYTLAYTQASMQASPCSWVQVWPCWCE
jgi:hypothetical protein